jgi:subtilisin family serine protease
MLGRGSQMSDGMNIRVGFSPERFTSRVQSGQIEGKGLPGQQESQITWPSGSDQIVVGAHTDKGGADEVAAFKSIRRHDISSNIDIKDISGKSGDRTAAPDLTVLSLGGTLPGPAAPVVAGEAALLLQQNPNLTPAQLKEQLTAMHQNQTIVVGAGDGNSTGSSRIVGWKDFVNGKTEPYDDHGQGTHVAAAALGEGAGKNPGTSRIIAWKDFVNDRPEPYDDHGQGTHVAMAALGEGAGKSSGNSRIVGWKDFVNDRPEPYDDHGQGTHVASILADGGSSGTNVVQAPRVETDGTMVVFDRDGREIRLNSNGLPMSQE